MAVSCSGAPASVAMWWTRSMSRSPTCSAVGCSVPVTVPGAGVAQRDSEPCLELGHAEGLRHEVVGAAVERLDLAALVAVGGEHHDGDIRELADAAADLEAVDVGQAKVEDDEVRSAQRDLVDGLCSRVGGEDLVAAGGQADPERLEERRIVVDDEHLGHGGRSGRRRARGPRRGR